MNTASPNNTDTFFGGRILVVLHEDGATEEIKVRQLRMADYERALPLLDDEIALTAFCCIQSSSSSSSSSTPFEKTWALTLQPESYETLQAAAREVNAKGFFPYAQRRKEQQDRENEKWLKALKDMPPEAMQAFAEKGRGLSLEEFVATAAIECGLSFEQALEHSYERLRSMLQAKRRWRASGILRLGQLIAIGINGKPDDFSELQRNLIDEIEDNE